MKIKTIAVMATLIILFWLTPVLLAGQHQHGNHHPGTDAPQVHNGRGTVEAVNLDDATVRMEHEPIASLRWPKMVMDLQVKDADMLKGLKAGDRITFDLVQTDKGFVITRIERQP